MDKLFGVAAGIDVHRDTVVVSIRTRKRRRESVETKTFGTFHDELDAMCAWLREHDMEVVGMESTGVYYKPVLLALRRNVPKRPVWLVNAAAVKQVPGRKTDVNDSAWLSKLVMHGLVRPSFLPDEAQEDLRLLTRHRKKRVGDQTSCRNRIIKLLETAGFKLSRVCSDVFGKTGRAIIAALAKGDKSPAQMAELAVGSLRNKRDELMRALAGDMSAIKRWLLQQLIAQLSQTETAIADLDTKIVALLMPHQDEVALLQQVPGIDQVVAATVIAEMGSDMSVFATAKKLASWSGFAPGSRESAGKARDAPTRKGNRWLRTMLVQAAHAAVRMKGSPWRPSYTRLLHSTGSKKKALFAIARKLCVTLFHVLHERVYRPYLPPPPTEATKERAKRRALEQLQSLGYEVTLAINSPLLPSGEGAGG
jgi:transposase